VPLFALSSDWPALSLLTARHLPRTVRALAAATLATGLHATAAAQGFSAYVSPPRVEARVAPGQTLRQVVEIQHVGPRKGQFRFYTNDWEFRPEGLVFSDALAPESCRPWVAIERRELSLEAGTRYRYRFEVTPPADAPARECRFALMIEGLEPTQVQGAVSFPVGGRIAVIVYVAVGGAAPQLALSGTRVAMLQGQPMPVLEVHNAGSAHGRLDGTLSGVDSSGQRFELAPVDVPILPGQKQDVALQPVVAEGQRAAPAIRYPLTVKGQLEWGRQRLPVDVVLQP
jgi:hypothetical protein